MADYIESETISVIVPIYNVEKYLNKCIDSIVNQTYKNLDIILVDDGSPDRCPQICDEYKEKDSRVRVFHKTNGGQGSARNVGLDNAVGQYIAFVDSDDYLKNDMYESLYNGIKSCDADMAVCGIYNIGSCRTAVSSVCDNPMVLSNEEALRNFYTENNIHCSLCNKLFKKELWNSIRVPENVYREDEVIFYRVLAESKKVYHIGEPKYYYIIRNGSSERQKFSDRNFISITSIDEQYEFIKEKYPQLEEILHNKTIEIRVSTLDDIIMSRQTDIYKLQISDILNYLQNHISKDKKLSKSVEFILKHKQMYMCSVLFKKNIKDILKELISIIKNIKK